MVGEASGGALSFDGNTIIKQVGSVPVNSRVTVEEQTWGIPVDVNTSHRSYIKHAAMHLFAAAPLIECDDKGNIKYVSEAKVHQIAKECIKDANILHDELHAYKKDGSSGSTDDGKTKQQLQQENAALKEANDALTEANELNSQYIDSLENAIKDKVDDNKVNDKYIEKLEDKIKLDSSYINELQDTIKTINDNLKVDSKYVEILTNKLKSSNIQVPNKPTIDEVGGKSDNSVLPSRPTTKDEKAALPNKPSISEVGGNSDNSVLPEKPSKPSKPDDPDNPTEEKKYPITQIENVVKSN